MSNNATLEKRRSDTEMSHLDLALLEATHDYPELFHEDTSMKKVMDAFFAGKDWQSV